MRRYTGNTAGVLKNVLRDERCWYVRESNFKKYIGDAADEEKNGGFLPKDVNGRMTTKEKEKTGGDGG